ncbi:MAG: CBS domain-containing protein [Myxococcales bacterium]|nr:CBS domain-containing protein [Myxococcales bacterium]
MSDALVSLGTALVMALLAGRVVARLHAPRVTGYLLVGMALGHSGVGRFAPRLPHLLRSMLLDTPNVMRLAPVKELAQALILATIGTGLRVDRMRGSAVFRLATADVLATLLLTSGLCLAALWGQPPELAATLGFVAVATAPAATLIVLRELEAEGPMTRNVVMLVGVNNTISLLGFTALSGFAFGSDTGQAFARVGVGALIGISVGTTMAVLLLQRATEQTMILIGLGGLSASWGMCGALGGDPLVGALVLGATLANASPHAEALIERVAQVDYPIYVAFFAIAGAELHIDLLWRGGGTVLFVMAAYVVGRSAGKLLTGPLSRSQTRGVGRRVGLALLAQAGLAISLADAAMSAGRHHGGDVLVRAQLLQTVVLASVTLFELVGPLAVRYAVVHAGEVKIINLLPDRVAEGLAASMLDTLNRLRRSLGVSLHRQPKTRAMRAVDIMRRSFVPIRTSMNVDDVMHTFASAPYDQYPVVDEHDVFQGVISYADIRSMLFDDELADKPALEAIGASSGVTCKPEATLQEIIAIFEDCHGEVTHMLVVTEDEPRHVIGIINQRDALVAYRRHG